MKIEEKAEWLKGFKTKELIDRIHEYEDKLDSTLKEEASFKDLNYGYLSGAGDCAEVKRISAELLAQAPDTTGLEKPLTKAEKSAWLKDKIKKDPEFPGTLSDAPDTMPTAKHLTDNDKKAWLERQRTENTELLGAITRQKDVAFQLDNIRINIEMTKKRLEGVKAILGLKTQQIHFLSDSE